MSDKIALSLVEQPISKLSHDRFNRVGLARRISELLCSWEAPQGSLVVAIYGSWGSGKTSLKNLILRWIDTADANRNQSEGEPTGEKPKHKSFEVVYFNPWLYKGGEEFSRQYFNEIARAIHLEDPDKEKQTSLLFQVWGEGLCSTAAISTLGITSLHDSKITALLLFIGGCAAVIKGIGTYFDKRSDMLNLSLDEKRKRLTEKLSALPRPVLTIVDDVDRLTSEEIRQLFKLIKACSDFPNLAFLVLCQRAVVEHSLSETMPESLRKIQPIGRQFLEKIVNVGITLPDVPPKLIAKMLSELLSTVLSTNSPKELTGTVQLLLPFIRTPRQVHRFCLSVDFQLSLFGGSNDKSIYPLDIVLMESIRTFEPDVFAEMEHSGFELLGQGATRRLSILAKLATEANYDAVTKILSKLFPATGFATERAFIPSEEAHSLHRICVPENFDLYFSMILEIVHDDLKPAGNSSIHTTLYK